MCLGWCLAKWSRGGGRFALRRERSGGRGVAASLPGALLRLPGLPVVRRVARGGGSVVARRDPHRANRRNAPRRLAPLRPGRVALGRCFARCPGGAPLPRAKRRRGEQSHEHTRDKKHAQRDSNHPPTDPRSQLQRPDRSATLSLRDCVLHLPSFDVLGDASPETSSTPGPPRWNS